ncbi:MAG: hypothetical protein M2R45_03487 [Verrucomicrobia subdivision 3 bacterium]|nr:hypothetical protein [Limisphaerales bacterium]MCS1416661.1 hypothetical protein [Limisphaerales bacterium]
MTFERVYCEAKRINSQLFERRLFMDGVSMVFRPLISLFMLLRPSLFQGEMEHLRALRFVKTREDFVSEIGAISDFNAYQLPFWRSMLGLRTSSRRLARLRKLLPRSSTEKA